MDTQPPQGPQFQAKPDGDVRGQRGGDLDRNARVLDLTHAPHATSTCATSTFYARELVKNGDVEIRYVKTNENIADFFAKFQPVATFRIQRDILMGIWLVKRA